MDDPVEWWQKVEGVDCKREGGVVTAVEDIGGGGAEVPALAAVFQAAAL